MVTAREIAEILGGPDALGHTVDSMMDLDDVVADGIPRRAFDTLINRISAGSDKLTQVSLRHKIIPRATYQRSRNKLSAQYSETAERIARVYAMAHAVWRDTEMARRFLMTPHPELNGKTPLDAALTEIGGRQVEEVIERGMHGLPV